MHDELEALEGKEPHVRRAEAVGFRFNQTMLRVKDPVKSLRFYREVLGMTLLHKADFESMGFTLYFLAYQEPGGVKSPKDRLGQATRTFERQAVLELTHNWGTETEEGFSEYHNGNSEPRGFGHIGLSVPDVYAACDWFESNEVEFVKEPDAGSMKGLAFVKDPDGYWIEILEATSCAALCVG